LFQIYFVPNEQVVKEKGQIYTVKLVALLAMHVARRYYRSQDKWKVITLFLLVVQILKILKTTKFLFKHVQSNKDKTLLKILEKFRRFDLPIAKLLDLFSNNEKKLKIESLMKAR